MRGMIAKVAAPRARRRRRVREYSDDETQRTHRQSRRRARRACASAAASARARARPAAAAARARRRAPASPSRASRAARCRCIGACRSAASTTSSPKHYNEVNLGRAAAGDRRRQARRRQAGRRGGADRGRRSSAAPRTACGCSATASSRPRSRSRSRRVEVGHRGGREGRRHGRSMPSAPEAQRKSRGQKAATARGLVRASKIDARPADAAYRDLERDTASAALWGARRSDHGFGSRAACRQSQLRRLRQGRGAEEAHLVHARRAARLSARHLHPAARHRSGGLRSRPSSASPAASSACSTCSPAAPCSAWRSSP